MNTPVASQPVTPSADYFRALELARTQALVARDMQTIGRLHSSEYELITPAGRTFSREQYLSRIAAEPFYAKWDCGPMSVRLSERMAVVRYQATIAFPSGSVAQVWHTDTYELQAGSWVAVWSQATRLQANPAPNPEP